MVCTALSRVLGFVRVAVIGAVFGATGVADVLNAVYMIPNNLRKLLAEGALSSALIPELARALERERDSGDGDARVLVRRVLSLLTVTVVVVVTLAVLFARPVVGVVLGFPEAWKMALAAELFRLVFPYLLLVSVGAVLMAVLNCHDVFVVPALANALVFWQLPFGILSVSVVTAHFPRMSRHAASGDGEALRHTFASALRLIVALMLPPAVFYLYFGEQVIQVALERMTFTATGTRLASRVLTGYAAGLVGVAVFNFVQRYFYAIADYRTPLLAALAVAAIDVPLAIIMKETGLRVAGLAVANSVAFSAGAVLLLAAARKRLHRFGGAHAASYGARVVAANAALALLLAGVAAVTGSWWQLGSTWQNAVLMFSIVVIAATATLALYRVLQLAWWQPAGT